MCLKSRNRLSTTWNLVPGNTNTTFDTELHLNVPNLFHTHFQAHPNPGPVFSLIPSNPKTSHISPKTPRINTNTLQDQMIVFTWPSHACAGLRSTQLERKTLFAITLQLSLYRMKKLSLCTKTGFVNPWCVNYFKIDPDTLLQIMLCYFLL